MNNDCLVEKKSIIQANNFIFHKGEGLLVHVRVGGHFHYCQAVNISQFFVLNVVCMN